MNLKRNFICYVILSGNGKRRTVNGMKITKFEFFVLKSVNRLPFTVVRQTTINNFRQSFIENYEL